MKVWCALVVFVALFSTAYADALSLLGVGQKDGGGGAPPPVCSYSLDFSASCNSQYLGSLL